MSEEIFSAVIFKNQLPSSCKITEVVSATRKQFLEKDIDCIQPINGLVRFDFLTMGTRLAFLQKGLRILNRTVLPMEWVDSMDTPQVKLTIDGLTRATSDSDLIAALKKLGAVPTSKVEPAYYWDHERNCPSNIKSGRRFIHIKKPTTPLPSSIQIGNKEANIKYYGQPPTVKSANIRAQDNVHLKSIEVQTLAHKLVQHNLNPSNIPLSQKNGDYEQDDEDIIPPSAQPMAPIFNKPKGPAKAPRSVSRGRSLSRGGRKSIRRSPSTEKMESPSKRFNKGQARPISPSSSQHDYFDGLPPNNYSQGGSC